MSGRNSNPLRGFAAMFCAMLLLGGLPLVGWKVGTDYRKQQAIDAELDALMVEITSQVCDQSWSGAHLSSEGATRRPDGSWRILVSVLAPHEGPFDDVKIKRATLLRDDGPPAECEFLLPQGICHSPVDLAILTPGFLRRAGRFASRTKSSSPIPGPPSLANHWANDTLDVDLPSELPTSENE